jgi:hypothetical protein
VDPFVGFCWLRQAGDEIGHKGGCLAPKSWGETDLLGLVLVASLSGARPSHPRQRNPSHRVGSGTEGEHLGAGGIF